MLAAQLVLSRGAILLNVTLQGRQNALQKSRPVIYLFIFISLTTKGKVSTEGNEAYRGVTYKDEHIYTNTSSHWTIETLCMNSS